MLSFSLASTLLILFFSPVHLPGGLMLPNVDQHTYNVYLILHVLCLGTVPRGRFLIVYMYCNLYNCL